MSSEVYLNKQESLILNQHQAALRKDSNRREVMYYALEKYNNDRGRAESFVRGWFKKPSGK